MEGLIRLLIFWNNLWCPADMVRIGLFCIDKYEAPNIPGEKPIVMMNAFQSESWCIEHEKRLCTKDEWEAGCYGTYDGPQKLNESGIFDAPGKCNNDKYWISVDHKSLILGSQKTREKEAKRLWQGELSGTRTSCVSAYDVHDTIGNVEEWVVSPDDRYGYALMGHYWSRGAKTCSSRVASHHPRFFYYSTGFRCCKYASLGEPQ